MHFVCVRTVRAQIRGCGSDGKFTNQSSRLFDSPNLLVLVFRLNFCSFRFSANCFSVTFSFFFKKYISFVLSQYKNKAHCTKSSIGKFFCLFKMIIVAQAV